MRLSMFRSFFNPTRCLARRDKSKMSMPRVTFYSTLWKLWLWLFATSKISTLLPLNAILSFSRLELVLSCRFNFILSRICHPDFHLSFLKINFDSTWLLSVDLQTKCDWISMSQNIKLYLNISLDTCFLIRVLWQLHGKNDFAKVLEFC